MLVDPESATLQESEGQPTQALKYFARSLERNHFNMHKFGKEDWVFDTVEAMLKKIISTSLQSEGILQAVQEGDLSNVKDALRRGNSTISTINGECQTPLHIAIQKGYVKIAKFLVDRDKLHETIDKDDEKGLTPLHYAVRSNSPMLVRLLCAKGADRELKDDTDRKPSDYAQSHSEIMWIFEEGLELDKRNRFGQTALLYFSKFPNLDAVRSLLSQGADIEAKNNEGSTPLAEACNEGHKDIAHLLIEKGANLEVPNNDMNGPLYLAAVKGYQSIVLDLLLHKANMERRNKYGGTPLVGASRVGQTQIVRLLLSHGANVGVHNDEGFTALTYASYHGHLDIVVLLLDQARANINEYNQWGMTALCEASRYGQLKVVQALLARGASLDAQISGGPTPISEARNYRQNQILRVLEEASR